MPEDQGIVKNRSERKQDLASFCSFPLLVLLSSLVGFVLFVPFRLSAQSFNEKIYSAYISGNMNAWEKALVSQSPEKLKESDQYDLVMAYYGLIGFCLGRDQESRARPYLNKAEVLADQLLLKSPKDPRYLALRGALYGFRLIYQPYKMMTIGPRSLKAINQAVALGPDCPQSWIEAGNRDWSMPAAFGGSKELALDEYKKAILLMEKNPGSLINNWYYLNAHMNLAAWYKERNMTFFANELYRKVVQIEPRFSWAGEMMRR